MQGIVVMLTALSGLGCHHGGCAAVCAPAYSACYSGWSGYSASAVSPQSYSTYVAPACYSACYSLCYSGSYTAPSYGGWCGCYGAGYGGWNGCGPAPRGCCATRKCRIFGGCGLGGGLCGRKRWNGCCDLAYTFATCYGGYGGYGGMSYAPAVYGSYSQVSPGAVMTPAPGPAVLPVPSSAPVVPSPTVPPAPAPDTSAPAPPAPAAPTADTTPAPPAPAPPAATTPAAAPPAANPPANPAETAAPPK